LEDVCERKRSWALPIPDLFEPFRLKTRRRAHPGRRIDNLVKPSKSKTPLSSLWERRWTRLTTAGQAIPAWHADVCRADGVSSCRERESPLVTGMGQRDPTRRSRLRLIGCRESRLVKDAPASVRSIRSLADRPWSSRLQSFAGGWAWPVAPVAAISGCRHSTFGFGPSAKGDAVVIANSPEDVSGWKAIRFIVPFLGRRSQCGFGDQSLLFDDKLAGQVEPGNEA
jgi:hypothetical protein